MKRHPKGTWMRLTSRDTLRALIKQRGLSYGQLGQMAGCHRTMISQLVNNHRNSCTPTLADRLSLCLGVPTEVLFVAKTSADSGQSDKRRKAA